MVSTTMDGYIPKLEQAIMIATEAHAGVLDANGQPYILHPLAVMMAMPPTDFKGRIVAVMHDVVEDTEVTLGTVASHFDNDIVVSLDAMSRRVIRAPEEAAARNMRVGDKEPYMQFIARLAADETATHVKLRDLWHNRLPERYVASKAGLRVRYDRAEEFLTASLLEFDTKLTADYLLYTSMITADQYIKRISKLQLA